MTDDPSLSLRKALVTAIRTAVAPAAVYVGRAPANAKCPYVVVATSTSTTRPSLYPSRADVTRLSIFSDATSDAAVMEIAGKIRAAVHDKRLSLGSGYVMGCRVTNTMVSPDADERTFMGAMTVEIALHE